MYKPKSSNISWVKWDSENETLEVCFSSGSTYTYEKVKEKVYKDLCEAKSCGSFFSKHIKNTYKHKRTEKDKKNEPS